MSSATSPQPAVTVVVLTYRRPELLPAAIELLVRQVDQVRSDSPDSRVLVIDNDPEQSAASAVNSIGGGRIVYVAEPRPGIAAARQRALDETPADHLLAFIDDDEVPSPDWLQLLLKTWERFDRPAGVAGRVIPQYETEPPAWIRDGAFFVRRSLPTGTPIDAAGAGNLLLDMNQVTALNLGFDVDLGTRGGEDTLFTRQLTSRGGRMVWCEEAAATDLIPTVRMTRDWVLRRAYAHGTVTSMVAVQLAKSATQRALTRLRYAAAGLLRVGGGVVLSAVGFATSNGYRRARGPWMVRRGLGMCAGAAGRVFDEYSRKAE